jgi:hypothetical protein
MAFNPRYAIWMMLAPIFPAVATMEHYLVRGISPGALEG